MRAPVLVPLLLGSILALACDKDTPPRAKPPRRDVTGTISIKRDAGSSLSLDVDGCWSGQMFSFYGVEVFHNPDLQRRLRVVELPVEGKRVVLLGVVPGTERIVIDDKACSTFDVRLEHSDFTLNDVRGLKGTVGLECSLPDGLGRLSVHVDLRDCSFDNRAKSL